MDIKEIKSDFIICEVPNHHKHKAILLDLIDKIPNNPYDEISKTDWNLPKTFERKYRNYFDSKIGTPYAAEIIKYFKAEKYMIEKIWFQQYEEKSLHSYHNHPKANFTNVYFLELPDEQFKTSIKIKDKEYDYEVREGQIITFPAYILHTSKENGNLRKTVISFNSSIERFSRM